MSESRIDDVRHAVRAALDGRDRAVLAVSGGVDSMVLLDAAAEIAPERITVATFDHGTGPAATEAASFVARSASERGLACVRGSATGLLTSEAELRDARWAFLRGVAAERNAVVVTAHTEDDQIETGLMRVMRGTGARGLAALYARSAVVRPFLHLRRAVLEAYARARGVRWMEDPTNMSPRFFRNRVRRDLLPALRRMQPSFDDELLSIARRAAAWRSEVETLVTTLLADDCQVAPGRVDVKVERLASHSLEELEMLWPEIAARAGVRLDRRGIERLASFTLGSRVGASIQVSGGWRIVRSRDAFQLRASADDCPPALPLATERGVRWGDWSFRPAEGTLREDAMSAWLPVDGELHVRCWRPGDTMECRAGRPPRKIKQLLSRAGITGYDRGRWPVVVAGERIVWVPGVRRADAATARSGRPGLPFICEYHRR